MPKEYKISKEVAEKQLQIFLDYYEFDLEEDVVSEDMKGVILRSNAKIINAIRSGKVEISIDNGLKVIQRIMNHKGEETSKVDYKELDGECRIISDKHEGHNSKLLATAGYLNGLGFDGMKKLKGKNLSVAECLGLLFLQI